MEMNPGTGQDPKKVMTIVMIKKNKNKTLDIFLFDKIQNFQYKRL